MAERREILLDIQVRSKDAEKKLAAVEAALIKNRKERAELNKAIKAELKAEEQNSEELQRLSSELAKVNVNISEQTAERRLLTKQIKNTNTAINAEEGSNEKLRAQLSLLTQEYNGLSKEKRDSTERGKELQIQTRSISDELKANEKAVGDNRRNVGNYESALDGLGQALDKIVPGFSDFTKGLKNTSSKGKEAGNSIGGFTKKGGKLSKAIGPLAKKLGGPLVQALIAITLAGIEAGKAIVNITREFDPLLIKVEQLTGATGDAAAEIAGDVKGIADTFGQDFDQVLVAANATASAFGVSVEEALDQISAGFVNGADASQNYLSQLEEYPAQLAAVGLSLEETNALLLLQAQEGIFSDKGIDAIKEAGIRIRELTPATREAIEGIGLSSEEIQKGLQDRSLELFDVIQQVSGKLGELEANSPEVGAALADIFGGPGEDAGLEFIKILADTGASLEDISRVSEDTRIRLEKQQEATAALATAKAKLADDFAPVVAAFDRFGKNILTAVITGFNNLVDFLTIQVPAAFSGFVAFVQNTGKLFKDQFDRLVLDLRIAAKEVQNFFSFSDVLQDEINQLKKQREQFANAGKSNAQAFSDAYNAERDRRQAEADGREAIRQAKQRQQESEEAKKRAAEQAEIARQAAEQKARAEEQQRQQRIKEEQDLIDELIAAEKRKLIEIEQATFLSEDKKNEGILIRQKRLLELETRQKLLALEADSEQAKLIQAELNRDLLRLNQQFIDSKQAQEPSISLEEETRQGVALPGVSIVNVDAGLTEEQRQAIRDQTGQFVELAGREIESAIQEGDFLTAFTVIDTLLAQLEDPEVIASFEDIGFELGGQIVAGVAAGASAISGVLGAVNDLIEVNDRESAERSRKLQIAQLIFSGISNAAQALFKSIATYGLPAGAIIGGIASAAIGTTTALQVNRLKNEPLGFAGGGFTGAGFMSDTKEPGRKIAGVVHDNEYVVPTNVMTSRMGSSLVGQLEKMRVTGSYAQGGFAGVSSLARQAEREISVGIDIADTISRLPSPVVSVKEINTVQNRVQVKEDTGL